MQCSGAAFLKVLFWWFVMGYCAVTETVNNFTFKGNALVTGANRGIGREVCRQLLALNWRVIACCRDQQAGAKAIDALREQSAANAQQLILRRVDVTSMTDIRSLSRWLTDSAFPLHALINNAGVFMESSASGDADPLQIESTTMMQTFNINTLGPLRMIQALAMNMAAGGRIVNVSSGMGQLSDMGGNYLAYRTSKTALNALTRVMAQRLAELDISINACCPGWVRTDMGGEHAERSVEQGADTIVWLATSADANGSGGFYRNRERIDW
jgi:NAD(P)-dependent dehydrogenase (short-subunit alcohol dehydrogenase family)